VSRARILAVDDQQYFRVFLEDLLQEEGYAVTTAESGPEALERCAAEPFDVIVTDLVMPGMDGSELVQRVKERWPEQDVVVVTSVGDLKTAIDAMKLGASDYLLKPLEKDALLRSLDQILDRRRMREEHGRLVAENLELLGTFTQYERVLGFFSTLSLETLADRIVEAFCLETNAQGGVLWISRSDDPERLRLVGVGGLVRVDGEAKEVDPAALPPELAATLGDAAGPRAILAKGAAGSRGPTLWVRFQTEGPLLGLLRLEDKLDGTAFDEADRARVARLSSFGAQAIANCMRYRTLEGHAFRDPATQAYTRAYFEDVASNEVRKASRFARHTSLIRIELDGAAGLEERLGGRDYRHWVQELASSIRQALRGTDLLAVESETRFCIHLPEADTLGAAVAKRRVRAAIERSAAMRALDSTERPIVLCGAATYPGDGSGLEALRASLDRRVELDRASVLRALELEQTPFRGLVDAFLAEGIEGHAGAAVQITRFVLQDLARRPAERGVLFLAPGRQLLGAVTEGLRGLVADESNPHLVLIAERQPVNTGLPVTWVAPERTGTDASFLVYFGEGPPYALLQEGEAGEDAALYHSSDPVLVEHFAFQLGHELGVPIGG
jgi:diguanylate cyclase (GGDEF)-like protein